MSLEDRVVRLGCFKRARGQLLNNRIRYINVVSLQNCQRLSTCRVVWHGGAAGNDARVVAWDIADRQSHNLGRKTSGRQATTFDAERCLRTQFISEIGAPELSKAWLMRCLSVKFKPSTGSDNKAEPPPEIRQSTTSSAVRPCVKSKIRCAACKPAASGTGCEASTISIRGGLPSSSAGRLEYGDSG